MDPPTILLSLEKDLQNAFQDFANYPTQSNRVKLRHRLMQIAGAMEVEAYNLTDEEEVLNLNQAVENLKLLADASLVAPKDALTRGYVPQAPLKKAVQPAATVNRVIWGAFGLKVLKDVLKLFKS